MAGNSKNFLPVFSIVTNASMATPVTSSSTDIRYLDNIGIEATFTGTPTGTFSVNVSVDQVNWVPLTFSATPVASGTAGSVYMDVNQTSAPYIQLTYTPTSGTGTLNAKIVGKAV